jgi:hypothetical protein
MFQDKLERCKCGKEVGIANSAWCDKCNALVCTNCCKHYQPRKQKVQTIWIVTYRNEQGEIVGPEWAVASKIKPTRWAKQAFAGAGYTYEIVNTGMTQAQYDEWEYQQEQPA